MKGWVTINTDAGWFMHQKVGSYAYWIKGDGLHLHGSGMLKGTIHSSTEAENRSIANALHVLKCSGIKSVRKIIVNRDNIRTKSSRRGSESERAIYKLLRYFWEESHKIKGYRIQFTSFYEFRHVKAHSDGKEKRDWVNAWCDARCKEQLAAWLKANPYTLNTTKKQ
jgi:hypothetical protein